MHITEKTFCTIKLICSTDYSYTESTCFKGCLMLFYLNLTECTVAAFSKKKERKEKKISALLAIADYSKFDSTNLFITVKSKHS